MTMSPSTCSQALAERISLHAVIFMLRKVESTTSTSDVNRGPEPCQNGKLKHSPFQFYALSTDSSCLFARAMVRCGRMRMRMTTILGVGSGDETRLMAGYIYMGSLHAWSMVTRPEL